MFHVGRIEIQYLRQRLLDECFHPFLLCIEKAAVSGYFICQFRCNTQIITDYALVMTHDIADQLFHLGYILPTHGGIGTEHFYRRHPVRCLIRKYIDRTLDINKFFIQETGFLFAGQLQDFIRIFFLGTGSKPQACPAHDKRTEEYDYQIQNGKLLTD